MGNDSDEDTVTIRGRMDDRGRFTIKEDDRIALGVNDLDQGERALLEMETSVLDRIDEGQTDE